MGWINIFLKFCNFLGVKYYNITLLGSAYLNVHCMGGGGGIYARPAPPVIIGIKGFLRGGSILFDVIPFAKYQNILVWKIL